VSQVLAVVKILDKTTVNQAKVFCFLGIVLNLLDIVGIFLFATFASGVANLVQGNSSKTRLENFLGELLNDQLNTNSFLTVVAGAMLTALILKTTLSAILNKKLITFLAVEETKFALLTFRKYRSFGGDDFYSRTPEEFYYAISISSSRIFNGIIYPFIQLLTETFLLLLVFTLLLVVSPATTIVTTLLLAGSVTFIGNLAHRRTSNASKLIVESSVKTQEVARQTYEGFKELRITKDRDLLDAQFKKVRGDFAENQAKVIWFQQLPRYGLEALVIMSAALLVIYEISHSDIRTALVKLSLYMITVFRILPSFQRIQNSTLSITNGLIASKLAREIVSSKGNTQLKDEEEIDQPRDTAVARMLVSNLTYKYPDSKKPTLVDLSLDIEGNRIVGLSGPSGIGKSTFLDILTGIRKPNKGSVSFFNSQGKKVVPTIAYVPQKPFLLNDSILVNITLSGENSSEDIFKVRELFEVFFGKDSIAKKEERLSIDSIVRNGNNSLSGGQVQRIAIMRALFVKSDLIVLDECFSGLDSKVTKTIFRELRKQKAERTILVVSHSKVVLDLCEDSYFLGSKYLRRSK
jgi:ABC-type bacteriocin/lantibiotic exporter with double-glycine peptidase domain